MQNTAARQDHMITKRRHRPADSVFFYVDKKISYENPHNIAKFRVL